MLKRSLILGGLMGIAALAVAYSPALTLRLGTVGNGASAKWETIREPGSAANHVLVLEKFVPTSEFEAAGADVFKIAGTDVEDIDALDFTNLTPATAGGGSPRWTLYYGQPGEGIRGWVHLDPTIADTNADGVIDQAEIQADPNWVYSDIQPGDVVYYLQILVDEQERVVLDDIMVRVNGVTSTFSGPGSSN
jgi:hypothetical protein